MFYKKIIFFILSGLAALALTGAQSDNQATEEMSKADICAIYINIHTGIAGDGKNPPANFAVYKIYADMINGWITKSRFLEVDTEIDKSWFENTAKLLEYMAQCKEFIELAQSRSDVNTEEFRKMKGHFEEAKKRFAELVKNPTPVEHSKLERLRAEKAKWEAQHHREKEKKAGE